MTTPNKILTTVFLMLTLFLVGCGKSFQAADSIGAGGDFNPAPTGLTPVVEDGSNSSSSYSATNTVDFKPVSIDEMNHYVAQFPLNNPSSFKISVNLTDAGNGRYAGKVKISYLDNGVLHAGTFSALSRTNPSAPQGMIGLSDTGVLEAEYNRWFTLNGKNVFTGFFQDSLGAVVLVIDDVIDFGDAQGGNYVSGSVWYKNFAYASGNFEYRKCWFIYTGPYSCRSGVVINKTGVEINDGGYRKLGTFSGMSKLDAFK